MSVTRPSVTVMLPEPVSGDELIDAVRTLSNGGEGTDFWLDKRHDGLGDVYVIGQVSQNLYDQIQVIPTPTLRRVIWIREDQTYISIDVVSHPWPVGYTAGSDSHADAVMAVGRFADELLQHFESSDVEKTPWPQEVDVCTTCNTITWLVHGDPYCPNDGGNPPIKTVKVAPVE